MRSNSSFTSFSQELLDAITEVSIWFGCSNELVTRWAKPHDELLENFAFVLPRLHILLVIPLLVVIKIWCQLIEGRPLNDLVFPQFIIKWALFVLFDEAAVRAVYVAISATAISLPVNDHSMSTQIEVVN